MPQSDQSHSTDQMMEKKEPSNGQNATEELHKEGFFKEKSEELFHKEQVDNTPFTIIMQWAKDEKGKFQQWFITWGKYRLTNYLETKEECETLIRERNWHLIGIYVGSIIEEYKSYLKTSVLDSQGE